MRATSPSADASPFYPGSFSAVQPAWHQLHVKVPPLVLTLTLPVLLLLAPLTDLVPDCGEKLIWLDEKSHQLPLLRQH